MTKAVVTTTTAIRRAQLQSNRHHQRTNIQLFMCQKPLLSPNQQCQNTEEISITIHTLARELAQLGVFRPCLWPQKSPSYLRGGMPSLSSTLWRQYPKNNNNIVTNQFFMAPFQDNPHQPVPETIKNEATKKTYQHSLSSLKHSN